METPNGIEQGRVFSDNARQTFWRPASNDARRLHARHATLKKIEQEETENKKTAGSNVCFLCFLLFCFLCFVAPAKP